MKQERKKRAQFKVANMFFLLSGPTMIKLKREREYTKYLTLYNDKKDENY